MLSGANLHFHAKVYHRRAAWTAPWRRMGAPVGWHARSTTAAPHGQHRGVGWAHRWVGTLARVWLKDAVKDALSLVFGLKDAVEDAPRVGLA